MTCLQNQPTTENLTVICNRLFKALDESVERNLAEGILLYGGLGTSILAYLALMNVSAPSIKYASLVSNHLGLKHLVHHFDEDELYDAIRVVIKTLDTFDPMEIQNSAPVYIGLKIAKEAGVNTIVSGDGCDELFAGYNFLFELSREKLSFELQKLWEAMHFSSVLLAELLKMEVKLPHLDPELKFAMGVDLNLKIRSERDQTWGKWILRKSFENVLPEEIVWRAKIPIEVGSGTATLSNFFNSTISDIEFYEKRWRYLREDNVAIRNKEQLLYYEIYRSVAGAPHPTDPEGKVCPCCSSNVLAGASYCRKCGAYPV
jgi:asparagine synthase (glutamine-hydrolysing)